ncbi:MAG: hypothetical protein GF370_02150 [Candidatus Nealsonbacteria bacterium]|nr:hypothetical protein [Candidatus Nealsonbacteria bacterium]
MSPENIKKTNIQKGQLNDSLGVEKVDFKKICADLLSGLKDREKEILARRFALLGREEKETLEAIGQDFNLSRERIRQIEAASLRKIKSKTRNYPEAFDFLKNHLKRYGGVRREELLLKEIGGEDQQNEVYFYLTLEDSFQRRKETENSHAFWSFQEEGIVSRTKGVIQEVLKKLKKKEEPVPLEAIESSFPLPETVLASYLDVSKNIQRNNEGRYGLKDWPEINPKGVKDKAYLALKRAGKPLHFTEVAEKVENAHVQTVHNELIKDDRFVLVGRGIYALAEWGYYPGHVKDVIKRILKEADAPLSREEIIEKVLQQRMIKKNTILLNLSSHDQFKKTQEGRYTIREA